MIDHPVLHMASPTHYANLMMRYMVATKLKAILPDLIISAVDMPYWDVHHPIVEVRKGERICRLMAEQHMPFERMKYLSDSAVATRFEWLGYGQRMENFPAKAACRRLFQADESAGFATSSDTIVCPVRGNEVLNAIHPGYTTIPVDFYADIIDDTGLSPIFMGQIDENIYVQRLRQRFPRAEFIPHKGILQDFQTIRKAKNIILPVSTFAWLAAWLSEAQTIVLPVFGMYNPKLFSLHDLLPVGDPAYRFFAFPEQPAVPLHELEEAHAQISGQWHAIDPQVFVPESL